MSVYQLLGHHGVRFEVTPSNFSLRKPRCSSRWAHRDSLFGTKEVALNLSRHDRPSVKNKRTFGKLPGTRAFQALRKDRHGARRAIHPKQSIYIYSLSLTHRRLRILQKIVNLRAYPAKVSFASSNVLAYAPQGIPPRPVRGMALAGRCVVPSVEVVTHSPATVLSPAGRKNNIDYTELNW